MLLGVLWWLGVVIGGIVLITAAVVIRGAPYVPTRRPDIEVAFGELYSVGPNDTLVDIGSGDGKVLRAAAERGARAVGVELNPFLVWLSRWLCRKYPSIRVVLADAWRYKLPAETTVVYVFGTGRDIGRIVDWVESQLNDRSAPLYVISYGFELPWTKLRSSGAHHLYQLAALQSDEP